MAKLQSTTVSGSLSSVSFIENFTAATITSNATSLDFTKYTIFTVNSPSANFTANFINPPITTGQTISVSLVITQGSSAYIPNVVTVSGTTQTVKWSGGTTPSGNANKTDVVNFTFICTATNTYTVIGSLASFS
jgi:hypothetical protein